MLSLKETSSDETATTSMVGSDVADGWWKKICNRFDEIDKLAFGWDGYGADRIAKSTMIFSSLLLGNVHDEAKRLSFPSINPMSNGSIIIEWRTKSHEITVEVNNTNDVDLLVESLATGATSQFHISSDFSKISDVLEESIRPVHAVA
jgi:hypothetical protein